MSTPMAIILPNSLSSPPPVFNFRKPKPFLSPKPPPSCCNFPLFPALLLPRNSSFMVTRAMGVDSAVQGSGDECCDDLVIEASLTRILPPALTLEHGLDSLKEALQEFKLHPPPSATGFIRFQVAVPPSANALDWFSCQPELSGVFPQFYVSKQLVNTTSESAFISKACGVFGIGAAVSFRQSPSSSDKWNSFRRYLLVDSLNVTTYGFIGINYDVESSFMKHDTGSLYFIIPQIELNEHEGFCTLAGTLVWDGSPLCDFKQALHSYEISLFQAIDHLPPMLENRHANFIKPTFQKFNVVKDEKLEAVYLEASVLGSYNNVAASLEMVSPSS